MLKAFDMHPTLRMFAEMVTNDPTKEVHLWLLLGGAVLYGQLISGTRLEAAIEVNTEFTTEEYIQSEKEVKEHAPDEDRSDDLYFRDVSIAVGGKMERQEWAIVSGSQVAAWGVVSSA